MDSKYYVIQEVEIGTMYFKIRSDDSNYNLFIEYLFYVIKDYYSTLQMMVMSICPSQ